MDSLNRMEILQGKVKNAAGQKQPTKRTNLYRNRICRICNNHKEDQVHVQQECPAPEQLNLSKATMENIFSEGIKILNAETA